LKKKPETIERIGLIANLDKIPSRQAVQQAASLIAQSGRQVACDAATAKWAGGKALIFDNAATLAHQVDLLLVFGGDGTMLQVVRDIDGARTPILGINAGRLGFLTAVPSKDLPLALQKLWDNDFIIEPRPLMEAGGQCCNKRVITHAFNDVVISHGTVSRLIELEVSVNNAPVTCYRGDGLIVCSPTGSTAYSLSAGGPIINPGADVLAITPICPHALSNRSVVVSLNSVVQVKLVSEKIETIVSADGQVQTPMAPGDVLTIRRSRRTVNLLHLGGTSFFDTVRRKLHWRGSYV
jgi:NAD+ kinase